MTLAQIQASVYHHNYICHTLAFVQAVDTVTLDSITIPSTADTDHILATATVTDDMSRDKNHTLTNTDDQIPLTIKSLESRKRPAISDPPSIKKQALSSTNADVKVTDKTLLVQAIASSEPSVSQTSRDYFSLPSLCSENTSRVPPTGTSAQESTPTVDADQLLQSLSTDSYNMEESKLASELGVDPSLLDLTGFMGIIQPEGVSIPGTPTTPLSLALPLVSLPSVDQPTSCKESEPVEISHVDLVPLVPSPTVTMEIKQATVDQSDERPIAVAPQIENTKSIGGAMHETTSSEELTHTKSEVVQLTSKDFDILREIEMNEDNILEGIPQELAATIQAIANIEEEDTVPWKN